MHTVTWDCYWFEWICGLIICSTWCLLFRVCILKWIRKENQSMAEIKFKIRLCIIINLEHVVLALTKLCYKLLTIYLKENKWNCSYTHEEQDKLVWTLSTDTYVSLQWGKVISGEEQLGPIRWQKDWYFKDKMLTKLKQNI